MEKLLERLEETARRRSALWFSLGFLVLLALLFADPLFSRRTFVGRDTVQFVLPLERAVHEAWRHGRLPLWIPEVSFGRPLASNPIVGAFYPPRIAGALFPFPLASKLFPIFHIWLAAAGAFTLARSLGIRASGSAFTAVVYALGGSALSEVDYPNRQPGVALLPFVLWAAARLSRRPCGRGAALFGLTLGLTLLAGDVFCAGLALAGSAILAMQEAPAGARGRAFRAIALASIPGVFLAGIQIVPTSRFVPETVRWQAGLALGEASRWSVSAWRLLEYIVPFPFGNGGEERLVWGDRLWSGRSAGLFYTLYPGVLASACVLAFRLPAGRRLFLYVFGSACLLAASVGYYLPLSLANQPSPIALRYPEKLMAGVLLAVAVWTGFAVDEMVRNVGYRHLLVPLLVSLLLLAASGITAGAPDAAADFAMRNWTASPHFAATASQRLPGLFKMAAARWAVFAGLLLLWRTRRRRAILAAGFLLVVADVGTVGKSFLQTEPYELVFGEPPSARAVRRLNRGPTFAFTPLKEYVFPEAGRDPFRDPYLPESDRFRNGLLGFTAAMFAIPYAFNIDYDLSDFYRVELAKQEFLRDDSAWPGVADFAGAFSARTAIVKRDQRFDAFDRPVRSLGPDRILVNPQAQPTVRFAREVLFVRGLPEARALVHERRIDLARTTLVEAGRDGAESLSQGRIRVVEFSAGRMELETTADGPSRLVLARAFSPFRDVRVDGRPSRADPANLCLTSIALSAGTHRILLEETLPGGLAGPAASLAGAAALILLAAQRQTPNFSGLHSRPSSEGGAM